MSKILKYTRRTVAAIIGGLILLYFLDFYRILPHWMHAFAHIQIVPAILGGAFGILAFMFLLTLFFGRIYCSVICPLGIMQDFILRLKLWWLMIRKKRKKYRTRYERPLTLLRNIIFAICTACFIIGISFPLMILDPYSNFGRIAVDLFRPGLIWINNQVAASMSARGNYTLYNVPIDNVTWLVIAIAAAVFVTLVILVWRKERIWCNTMCPVGTLLGYVSRYSLFRIRLSDNCNNCKLCASNCKSRCIDSENKVVDHSRCVTCFNCLDKCKRNALSYEPTGWKVSTKPKGKTVEAFSIYGKKEVTPKPTADMEGVSLKSNVLVNPATIPVEEQLTVPQVARRRFIKGSLLTLGVAISAKLFAKAGVQSEDAYGLETSSGDVAPTGTPRIRSRYALPPGAISLERFKQKCTACQLCISKCPTQVLRPAFLENGLTGMMQPYMHFRLESFCNYDCMECFSVCPNNALLPLTLEEKKLIRVGNVNFIREECVVYSKHQDCGACAEHCPTRAVHMVPFEGVLRIPEVTPELCIGCGGCESICPVVPAAIYVEGLVVHEQAAPLTEDIMEDVQVDDFGF